MTVLEQATELSQKVSEHLRAAENGLYDLEILVMQAHRAGFTEALDKMGVPEASTPMERIARAGGVV